jgi:hypothetical protein
MSCRIRSNEGEDRGEHSNETRESNASPISTIGKFCEHCFRSVAGCQHPEWNKNGKEAHNM